MCAEEKKPLSGRGEHKHITPELPDSLSSPEVGRLGRNGGNSSVHHALLSTVVPADEPWSPGARCLAPRQGRGSEILVAAGRQPGRDERRMPPARSHKGTQK